MAVQFLRNKKILVTGCCGTVGSELIKQILADERHSPHEVIGVDNNESQLFFLDQQYVNNDRARFYLGDLRDRDNLTRIMKDIDIVFHTAALKHVVLCERTPYEAVQTNILGVENLISAAYENNVKRVIFTSSDKAVNPTNVMGTSKLMGERLITAANSNKRKEGPVFASTRFGNVLGSNGSVIPIFYKQIEGGGPVTLTDPDMTRFVMTIEQAARLVIDSAAQAKGGEVFITKMPVVRIQDIAEVMIQELAPTFGYNPADIKIEVIGTKPGEKLYEELMSDEETRRSIELENYFSVMPAFRGFYNDIDYEYNSVVSTQVTKPYNSSLEPAMTQQELRHYLLDNELISPRASRPQSFAERYWPGDKESK